MTKTTKVDTLTEKQIRAIASPQSFARGTSYYQDGSIRSPKRRGNMLYADCQGTSLYRVTAELDKNGIGETSCTCPYDRGGACKHIVALLLTWLNDPGRFQTQGSAADLLAGMNKEQLVEIIETVLRREPDFYDVIRRKVGKAKAKQEEMTLASLRSLLRLTLEAHPPEEYDGEDYYDEDYYDEDEDYPRQDWADEEPLGPQLEELLGFARDWIKGGDRAQGLAAYQMFIEESLARLKKMHYEDYEVSEFANGCAQELGKLAQGKKTDEATRQALFEWAIGLAGKQAQPVGFLDNLIDGTSTKTDLPRIEKLYKDQLAKSRRGQRPDGGYYFNVWTDRLLEFYRAAGRDDDILALLLEEGRVLAHAQKLLELKRADEAVQAARKNLRTVSDCLTFAKALGSKGHAVAALAIAEQGLKDGQGFKDELYGWLAKRYEECGEPARVLEIELTRFKERPDEALLKRVKKLATASNRWDAARADLIAFLNKQQFARHLLVDIYLDEGDLDAAERIAKQTFYSGNIRLKIAQAAEKVDPRRAIALYQGLASGQIAGKNRSAYIQAVEYLQRVKKLYRKLGEDGAWSEYLAKLRNAHPTLRAFQEELSRL
jgi:uncharacterized Zn finger protein